MTDLCKHETFEDICNICHRDNIIAVKDEIITAHERVIADQQAEIEGLRMIIKDLERRLDHAEWLVDKYRGEEETK